MKPKRKPSKPVLPFEPHLKSDVIEVEIDNPSLNRSQTIDRINPLKVRAYRNLNESPIGRMLARGQLTPPQGEAASKFRVLWEDMGGRGVQAMDYAKTPVDGGGIAEPISIRQMDAAKKLNELRKHLGGRTYNILVKIVGEEIEPSRLGQTHRERLTIADYMKDGLGDTATFWGLQTAQRKAS